MLNLVDPEEANRTLPFFRLAFRPFFLMGSIFSLIALALWACFWLNLLSWNPYGGWVWWHGHEMVFGFVATIIVGFLLTAVQTWTGQPSISGWPLAGLFLLWLLPRLLIAFPVDALEAVIPWLDMAFLPLAALVMARLVIKVRQWRNLFFVPVLLLLAFTNGQMHWAIAHGDGALAKEAGHSAILLIVMVIVMLGGRVIPFFTASGTGLPKAPALASLEIVSIASVAILTLLQVTGLLKTLPELVIAALFALAGVCHLARWWRWRFWTTLQVPLLWSLHLAYGFVVLGFILCALFFAGALSSSSVDYTTSLHSFTVGGMGLLIFAMMSRVSLGHTGRPLQVGVAISIAYALLALACITRVWLPLFLPSVSHYWSYVGSIFLWLISYSIFVLIYAPILSKARVDGRPG